MDKINYWEEKSEILPILEEKEVLKALSQFVWCSQQQIKRAVSVRMSANKTADITINNEPVKKRLQKWYYNFSVPKTNWSNEFRTISVPADHLKLVQNRLLKNLREIPVSQASQWWEIWTSPKKNALLHRYGSYTYAGDIKSAYPSVSAQRVHKNISAWFRKFLDFSYPYLSQTQQENFIDVLVSLVTQNDWLPQWAPTSARLLNIVMAKTDKQINQYIHEDLQSPVYSRYIDDLVISFKHFKEYAEYEESIIELINQTQYLKHIDDVSSHEEHMLESLLDNINEFLWKPVHIVDESSRKRLRSKYSKLKDEIIELMLHDLWGGSKNDLIQVSLDGVYEMLKKINSHSLNWEILNFKKNIQKIVNNNWRDLKFSKENMRTPSSSTAKEITGIMIWKDWRLWISQKKMKRYVALAKTAFNNPSLLPSIYQWPDGKVNGLKLSYTLNGIRSFIIDVKDHSPEYFEKRYQWCKKKYFESIPSHPKGYARGYDVLKI